MCVAYQRRGPQSKKLPRPVLAGVLLKPSLYMVSHVRAGSATFAQQRVHGIIGRVARASNFIEASKFEIDNIGESKMPGRGGSA